MQLLTEAIILVSLLRLCVHATRVPFPGARSPLHRTPLCLPVQSRKTPSRVLGSDVPLSFGKELEHSIFRARQAPSGTCLSSCLGALLNLRGGASLQLNVKTMSGRTITVEVEPDEAIESLKSKIAAQEGVPAEQQRLVFGSKQLDGRRSVADYGLGDQSTISLVLRLRGGSSCDNENTVSRCDARLRITEMSE
jgi:hypothetical protein